VTTSPPVHPFPARMAPELALAKLPRKPGTNLRVLDPMMGSGTIPVLASLQGYRVIGVDCDPLAVIIARTSARRLPMKQFRSAAEVVARRAGSRRQKGWSHPDDETQEFIDYWFDPLAQRRLGALAGEITLAPPQVRDQLWCAFSRLIITKDAGASRARDVSHSRPHRVRDKASFDPIEQFPEAVAAIIKRHRQVSPQRPSQSRVRLLRGDARKLRIRRESVDLVLTSPPYLQAIDYLRGHRMSLVWMGYSIDELRELRGASVGAERGDDLEPSLSSISKRIDIKLSQRGKRILSRYVNDLSAIIQEIHRVLRPSGHATLVVADATLEGVPISISKLTRDIAKVRHLTCTEHKKRTIPTASRYLPPPKLGGRGKLDKRMRVEHCMSFTKA
jgi:DNA modification methylase